MLSGRSIPLTSVFGIRIGVDPSWFLALFLFIWWLTDYYQSAIPGNADNGAFLLATLSALLFFGSILLHELGHAVVAIRNGIGDRRHRPVDVRRHRQMAREATSPGASSGSPSPGPLVTLAIVGLCAGIGIAAGGRDDFWAAMTGDPQGVSDACWPCSPT